MKISNKINRTLFSGLVHYKEIVLIEKSNKPTGVNEKLKNIQIALTWLRQRRRKDFKLLNMGGLCQKEKTILLEVFK